MKRPPENRNNNPNGRKFATQQSLDSFVKSICDIMRRSNCPGALQYVPELTWILFLRILDDKKTREAEEAKAVDVDTEFSIFVSVALLELRQVVIPVYLEKVLNSPICREQAARLTQGMANRNLVLQDLKKMEVPVPAALLRKAFRGEL